MGKHTNIQWSDSTINPNTGCDGCELWKWIESLGRHAGSCYAGNLQVNRLSRSMPALYSSDFTEVRLAPGRMAKAAAWSDLTGTKRPDKPWLDGLPRVIFLADMGDLMSRAIPFEYLRDEVMANITSKQGRRHIWMILTKQPRRLAEFAAWYREQGFEWPSSVMSGTSVTTQATTSRITQLLRVPGRRFVSAEPLWEQVNLTQVRWKLPDSVGVVIGSVLGHTDGKHFSPRGATGRGLEFVICGGESGRDAHPFDLAWARRLRDDCHEAGVSFFLKQLGAHVVESFYAKMPGGLDANRLDLRDSHGGEETEWPDDLRGCRAFPRVSLEVPA
jgi:protein gp37